MVVVGELVASAVVKELVSKLGSELWSELGLLWSFKDDLKEMKTTLISVQAVLNDAEKQSFNDEPVRLWLKRLKVAAYKIEDMLDKFQTQNKFLHSPVMAYKLNRMRKRLDKIAEERSRYSLRVEAITHQQVIEGRETYSAVNRGDVLGREEEARKIINRLLSTTSDTTSFVLIPIVGIGGLGKTTLAKLIFNDHKIKEDFELRIWVYAADFNVEKMAEAILSSSGTGDGNRHTNLQSKTKGAQEVLDGKKFLIVLDDVWNENKQYWVNFKDILQGGKKESKIIVTTRSERVSMIMDAIETQHKLKPLSDDVCLELFERRAFGLAGAKDKHLASIGKEIVKKCKGVPLTSNALGGMLCLEKEKAAWKKVRDSDLWELKEEEGSENEIMSSLKLSYHYMPSPLKLCFVYCSSYPRAFELDKNMLIQQWISQRFIQAKNEVEAQQYGDSYVNRLLSMSFLEEEMGPLRDIQTYKMHDLVYDLARWIAMDEVSILDATESGKDNVMEYRYASVTESSGPLKEIRKALPWKVRALHFQMCTSLPKEIFSYTKCLRVLDFTKCSLDELPTSIYKLKQLRYLQLEQVDERIGELWTLERLRISISSTGLISNSSVIPTLPTSIGKLHNLIYLEIRNLEEITYTIRSFGSYALRSLPDSLGKLVKLQTLNIFGCSALRSLPESLGNLIKLETLNIRSCYRLERLPESLGNLEKLKKLDIWKFNELKRLPESLGNLVNLETLYIYECHALEMLPESLGNLVNLETLNIYGCSALRSLPESLGNLVKLEALNIRSCYRLARLSETLGSLLKLKTLDIWNFNELKRLPESLGNLVNLETLNIIECHALEMLPESLSNLVKLETLNIKSCYRVERLPESLGSLVKLKTLNIWTFYELKRLPESLGNLINLEKVNIYGCYALRSLPESLGNLVNLESLNIRFCYRLERLPESLGSLLKLKTLDILSFYELKRLPESLGNLVNLETLNIVEYHALEMLPESLGNLVNLETLCIDDCRAIRSLPESLSNLVNLKTLHIINSPNSILPVSIGKLHNLIDLDLSFSYKLFELPDSIGGLQKLYSLKLYRCYNLGSLPESLGNLMELRTLDIRGCAMLDLDELPKAICNMRHLKIQRDESLELLEFKFDTCELELHLVDGQGGHVVHQVTDAKRIDLKERGGSIKSLIYHCGHKKKGRLVEAMLEALQPHQNLQELFAVSYEGSMFPSWMRSQTESFLPNLVKIRLEEVSNCEHLPVLGQLPKLEEIVILRMPKLRRISEEFCGARNTTAGASFPSLKRLELQNMDELEEWVTSAIVGDDGERGASPFPCLEDLTIWNCSKLKTIRPCVPPSVRRLSLSSIEHNLLTFVDVSNRIKYLQIQNYDLAHFRPSIRRLTSLETLKLEQCIRLTSFPEWLGELCQLQHLDILKCNYIDRLPQSIQSLTALTRLCITGCRPSLLERTRKETGEDWAKISHIDNIEIASRRG